MTNNSTSTSCRSTGSSSNNHMDSAASVPGEIHVSPLGSPTVVPATSTVITASTASSIASTAAAPTVDIKDNDVRVLNLSPNNFVFAAVPAANAVSFTDWMATLEVTAVAIASTATAVAAVTVASPMAHVPPPPLQPIGNGIRGMLAHDAASISPITTTIRRTAASSPLHHLESSPSSLLPKTTMLAQDEAGCVTTPLVQQHIRNTSCNSTVDDNADTQALELSDCGDGASDLSNSNSYYAAELNGNEDDVETVLSDSTADGRELELSDSDDCAGALQISGSGEDTTTSPLRNRNLARPQTPLQPSQPSVDVSTHSSFSSPIASSASHHAVPGFTATALSVDALLGMTSAELVVHILKCQTGSTPPGNAMRDNHDTMNQADLDRISTSSSVENTQASSPSPADPRDPRRRRAISVPTHTLQAARESPTNAYTSAQPATSCSSSIDKEENAPAVEGRGGEAVGATSCASLSELLDDTHLAHADIYSDNVANLANLVAIAAAPVVLLEDDLCGQAIESTSRDDGGSCTHATVSGVSNTIRDSDTMIDRDNEMSDGDTITDSILGETGFEDSGMVLHATVAGETTQRSEELLRDSENSTPRISTSSSLASQLLLAVAEAATAQEQLEILREQHMRYAVDECGIERVRICADNVSGKPPNENEMHRLVCDQIDIRGGVDTRRDIPATATEVETFERGGVREAGNSGEWVKKDGEGGFTRQGEGGGGEGDSAPEAKVSNGMGSLVDCSSLSRHLAAWSQERK